MQCATIDKPNFNFRSRVDTASNGANAVEMVRKRVSEGFNYKFIMMDCNMPKMDGYEATQHIRKIITNAGMAQPYIVAVSGHVEEKYIERARVAGMDSLIAKPARVDDIKEVV